MNPVSPVIPALKHLEIVIARDQDEYQNLPALPIDGGERIITRWRLSWRERLIALVNGNIYLSVWRFRQPLQPVMLDVNEPDLIYDAKPVAEGNAFGSRRGAI